jgi:diguanylate cyclase (GGDEF)-like protein
VTFGKRLALFFVLFVILPTLALTVTLLIVSEDARREKADARLAGSVETATALYGERVADGEAAAAELASAPGLPADVAAGRRLRLLALAREQLAGGAVAVEIVDSGGTELVVAGRRNAIAFGEERLQSEGEEAGAVRVSTTSARAYGDELRHLTARDVIVTRNDAPLASTVSPPATMPGTVEPLDLELSGREYRARRQLLDPASADAVLVLGPPREGGVLEVGSTAALPVALFIVLAGLLAFTFARALTELHERVATQAVTDPLTGLWNRRRTEELLVTEEERRRRLGHPYSVLIVDVDEFKSINDSHGHPQGDGVLRGVAEVIRSEIRAIDEGARYGGDELALILPETDPAGAVAVAERLRSKVEDAGFTLASGAELRVSVSVGVATAPDCAQDVEELVRAADEALLRAKRDGKNRVVSAPPRGRVGGRRVPAVEAAGVPAASAPPEVPE